MTDDLGPGAGDLFDPWDLDDVFERVVLPVVQGLVRPEELGRVELGWGERRATDRQPGDELYLLVTAAGSRWLGSVWQMPAADNDTLGEVAANLASMLEDWMAENVHWGEQAVADYRIPARTGGSGRP